MATDNLSWSDVNDIRMTYATGEMDRAAFEEAIRPFLDDPQSIPVLDSALRRGEALNALPIVYLLPVERLRPLADALMGLCLSSTNWVPQSRELLLRLPREELVAMLPNAIAAVTAGSDYWEFARLVELCLVALPEAVPDILRIAAAHPDPAVQEVVEWFDGSEE